MALPIVQSSAALRDSEILGATLSIKLSIVDLVRSVRSFPSPNNRLRNFAMRAHILILGDCTGLADTRMKAKRNQAEDPKQEGDRGDPIAMPSTNSE